MWVLVPTGEILSFASPKESIQRKGGPDAAYLLRSSVLTGVAPKGHKPEGTSCPSRNVRHPCRTLYALGVLRAIPAKTSGIYALWVPARHNGI